MAATASLGPLSLPETLSHTSRMNSQFSDVRFSSVALAVLESEYSYRIERASLMLTDCIVEDILLCSKHCVTAVFSIETQCSMHGSN